MTFSNVFCTTDKIFSDPLELQLGSAYNLNSITKVTVTDHFLSLDKNVRQCLEKEGYGDCLTANYMKKLKDTCNCIPLKLGIKEEVENIVTMFV